jgi:hypothetical protein
MNLADTAGRGVQDRQAEEMNALMMDSRRQQMDQQEQVFDDRARYENTRYGAGAATYLLQVMEQNPERVAEVMPSLNEELQRRGLGYFEKTPTREDLELMRDKFMTALGGPAVVDVPAEEMPYGQRDPISNVYTPGRGVTSQPRTTGPLQQYDRYVEEWRAGMYPGTELMGSLDFAKSIQQQASSGRAQGTADVEGTPTQQETEKGKIETKRDAINVGIELADATILLRRGLQLIELVGTGRPQELALAAKTWFGVAGADETELSANLGKAVLSQLRETFGAQFTENEGKRLEYIEANFGKSTAGNKRLLQQALKMADRKARRGLLAAQELEDDFAATEIQSSLDYDLEPLPTVDGGDNSAPEGTIISNGQQQLIKQNGQWVPYGE